MKLFSFFSLRQWLTWPYIVLVLGVAALIATLSYRTGSQAVDTVANHLQLETVARIAQAVDRHVVGSAAVLEAAFPSGMPAPDSIGGELDTLRTRFWIATSLHIDPNNYVYYGNRKGEFFGLWRFNQQDAELRLRLDPTKPRQLYRFSGINGALSAPVTEQKMFEPRARPWYKAGENSNAHTWTSIYIDFRNDDLVATRARHVLDTKGDFQGVVATDLSLKRLNDFVRRLRISENAVAFIIEFDGNLIASSKSPNIGIQADGSRTRINVADSDSDLQQAAYAQVREQIASGKKIDSATTLRFSGPHDEAVELAYDSIRDDAGLDWLIVVAVPRSDFMQGVTANVKRTVLIGVLGSILAVLLGLGVFEWVGRDLRRLTRAAQEVGQGRTETLLDVYRNDEIGVLANNFRQMQERLRTDALTGLDNRDLMERNIGKRIEQGRRASDALPFAILFIDLNNFKLINDRYGHDAGDRVLVEIGQRLRAATREEDRVARYAGDEFLILLNDIPSRQAAERVRLNIEKVLRAPLKTVDNGAPDDLRAGGAVGLACYPDDGDSAEGLIKHGDHDMYARKKKPRSETAI
jgi:diguanylate cyclase (GGDEF)-like protein